MKSFSFFLVFLGFCADISFVSAEESLRQGISISPMFQEISLDKDQESGTASIEVSNATDSLVTLRLTAVDFGSLDESGGVAFLGSEQNFEKQYGLASWIRLDRDAFALSPGESQIIQVLFENRESLSPGGHYGAIVFKAEDADILQSNDDKQTDVAVNQSFASLIFVKKIGGEIYDLDIKDAEVKKNLVHLPEDIRIRFQNTGNVHAVPRGVVTIADPRGNIVRKGVINQESSIILPETFRSYTMRLEPISFAYIPGRYTLSMQYRYDGKDDFITQTEVFFFIPFFEALTGITAAVFGIALIIWYRGGRKRKK